MPTTGNFYQLAEKSGFKLYNKADKQLKSQAIAKGCSFNLLKGLAQWLWRNEHLNTSPLSLHYDIISYGYKIKDDINRGTPL